MSRIFILSKIYLRQKDAFCEHIPPFRTLFCHNQKVLGICHHFLGCLSISDVICIKSRECNLSANHPPRAFSIVSNYGRLSSRREACKQKLSPPRLSILLSEIYLRCAKSSKIRHTTHFRLSWPIFSRNDPTIAYFSYLPRFESRSHILCIHVCFMNACKGIISRLHGIRSISRSSRSLSFLSFLLTLIETTNFETLHFAPIWLLKTNWSAL